MTTITRNLSSRLLPIAFAQTVGLSCGILGVSLTSRYVEPEEWGRYSLFLTFVPLGVWVFFAGINKGVSRQWAACTNQPALARQALGASVRKVPWLTLAIVGICAWFFGEQWPQAALLTWLSALMTAVFTLAQTTLQASRYHWSDFAASATGSLTRTFLPLVLAVGLGWGGIGLWYGFLAHTVVTAVVAGWLARPTSMPPKPDFEPLAQVYQSSLFMFVAAVHWTLSGLIRWTSAWFFNDETTGLIALAGSIAMIPTSMVGTVVLLYVQPSLYSMPLRTRANFKALTSKVDKIAGLCSVVGIFGLLTLQWVLPYTQGWWVHDRYAASLQWVFPVGCFTLMIVLGQLFQAGLLAARRETACGPIEVVQGIVVIGLTVGLAWGGDESSFRAWLCISPIVPWLLYRTWLRHTVSRVDGEGIT